MKNNKEIARLTEEAKTLAFPDRFQAFVTFKTALRNLVEQNFGYMAQQTFGYDEYSRTFYWESDESTIIKLDGMIVSTKRHFSLDPHKSIEEEFARIFKEYGALAKARTAAARALRAIGGEVH